MSSAIRGFKTFVSRIQLVAWIAMISGLALIVALNHTLTALYSDLDLTRQLVVIFLLICVVSITGYSTITISGFLKPKGK